MTDGTEKCNPKIEENQREDRRAFRKFIVLLLAAMVVGGITGAFSTMAAKEQAEQTNLAVQAKAVTEAKKNDYKERKERESTLRKLNGALKRCEQAIEDVETKTAELAEQMSKPEIATDYEKASKLSEEIAVLKEKEEELTAQWMELSEQIETFS